MILGCVYSVTYFIQIIMFEYFFEGNIRHYLSVLIINAFPNLFISLSFGKKVVIAMASTLWMWLQ